MSPPDAAIGTNPTNQPTAVISLPAVDPQFSSAAGFTAAGAYWSLAEVASNPVAAWRVSFTSTADAVQPPPKTDNDFVRAVRTGSCTE